MLILLPPSEGKSPAVSGHPVELSELSFPELTDPRERVAEELIRVSSGEEAATVLKVGKTLSQELERNTTILSEPAAPAPAIYSGVLYEALDIDSLSREEKLIAEGSILIISALWGALRLSDYIPAYRLSMGVKLGNCGNLATFWRSELSPVLDTLKAGQLVIDCRSTTYANAWKPPAKDTFLVKVEQIQADGSRKVISHFAKHYRGLFARYLVTKGLTHVDDIDDLSLAVSADWSVEITQPQGKVPGTLILLLAP